MIKSFDRVTLGKHVRGQAANLVLFCSLLYILAGSLWSHFALGGIILTFPLLAAWILIHGTSFIAVKMPRIFWFVVAAQMVALQLYFHTIFKVAKLSYLPLAPVFFVVTAIAMTAYARTKIWQSLVTWSAAWSSAIFRISNSESFAGTPNLKKAMVFAVSTNLIFVLGFYLLTYFVSRRMSQTLNLMGNLKAFDERRIQASKLQSLGELTASLSHEISNPLTSLKGYLHQVSEEVKESKNPQQSLELVRVAHERMNVNLDRILEITRLVRNFSRQDPNQKPEYFSVRNLVRDSAHLMKHSLKSEGVELELKLPDQDFEIQGSQIQMGQVLVNLIANARDACEGSVDKKVTVGNEIATSGVEIIVEDTGGGIAEDIKEDVFRPFFTTKDVGKGTGLGLSISKTIVARHQGEISFVSSYDTHGKRGGTKFIVSLPFPQNQKKVA